MKKFYFILIAFLIMGCSTDEPKNSDGKKILSPPSWIVGEWRYLESEFNPRFHFLSDDMIIKLSTFGYRSIKQDIQEKNEIGVYAEAVEIKHPEYYKLTVHINSDTEVWEFFKIDETHIKYNDWIYTKID